MILWLKSVKPFCVPQLFTIFAGGKLKQILRLNLIYKLKTF